MKPPSTARRLIGLAVVTALVGSLGLLAPVAAQADEPTTPPPAYTDEQVGNYHALMNSTWLSMVDTSPEALKAATEPDPSAPNDDPTDPSVRKILEEHVIPSSLTASADRAKAVADWFSGATPAATKVRTVHDWVASNMYYYSYNPAAPASAEPDRGGLIAVLGSIAQFNKYGAMTGQCDDYARLTATLLRASGVPALSVWGYGTFVANDPAARPFVDLFWNAGGRETATDKLDLIQYAVSLHWSFVVGHSNHSRNLRLPRDLGHLVSKVLPGRAGFVRSLAG